MSTRITAGATLRAAGGGVSAVVRRLRKCARGGGGRRQEEVRGIRDPRTKPSYELVCQLGFGKLAVQNSRMNQILIIFTLIWSNTAQ